MIFYTLGTQKKSRKLGGEKSFLPLPTIKFFGNILVCSQQNCLTLRILRHHSMLTGV